MFDNVGGKIKSISKVLCPLLIVIVIIGTLVILIGWDGVYVNSVGRLVNGKYINERYIVDKIPDYAVFLYSVCICFGIYFLSLLLYGFGQLIENTSSTNDQQKEAQEKAQEDKPTTLIKEFFSTYANNMESIQQEKKSSDVIHVQKQVKSINNESEVKLFLEEIKSIDSMVAIWNTWRKYSLDKKYPSVNDYIRQSKDAEQLHGLKEDSKEEKKIIKEMLQGESSEN